jgi:hypothetical protein
MVNVDFPVTGRVEYKDVLYGAHKCSHMNAAVGTSSFSSERLKVHSDAPCARYPADLQLTCVGAGDGTNC